MTDLTRAPSLSLLERTRDLATLSEDELKRAWPLKPPATATPRPYGRC